MHLTSSIHKISQVLKKMTNSIPSRFRNTLSFYSWDLSLQSVPKHTVALVRQHTSEILFTLKGVSRHFERNRAYKYIQG